MMLLSLLTSTIMIQTSYSAASAGDTRANESISNVFVLQHLMHVDGQGEDGGFLREQGGNADAAGTDESANCAQWRLYVIPPDHEFYERIRGPRNESPSDHQIYFKLQNVASQKYLRFYWDEETDRGDWTVAIDVTGNTGMWTDLVGYLGQDLAIVIESGYSEYSLPGGDAKLVGVCKHQAKHVLTVPLLGRARFRIRRPNTNASVHFTELKQLPAAPRNFNPQHVNKASRGATQNECLDTLDGVQRDDFYSALTRAATNNNARNRSAPSSHSATNNNHTLSLGGNRIPPSLAHSWNLWVSLCLLVIGLWIAMRTVKYIHGHCCNKEQPNDEPNKEKVLAAESPGKQRSMIKLADVMNKHVMATIGVPSEHENAKEKELSTELFDEVEGLETNDAYTTC
eukprot:740382_1